MTVGFLHFVVNYATSFGFRLATVVFGVAVNTASSSDNLVAARLAHFVYVTKTDNADVHLFMFLFTHL
jgi:hypothetical protein